MSKPDRPACPRCLNGKLALEEDLDGPYWCCMACGFRVPVERNEETVRRTRERLETFKRMSHPAERRGEWGDGPTSSRRRRRK